MGFWQRFKRRPAPMPRLLPLEIYPEHVDEAGRDRVDKQLREQLHTIPTESGKYLDNQAEEWTLNEDGTWTDPTGDTRSSLYTPIMSAFGPMIPVTATATVTVPPIEPSGDPAAASAAPRPASAARTCRGASTLRAAGTPPAAAAIPNLGGGVPTMTKALIRDDEFGLYVLTGGYAFRPPAVAKREFFAKDPRTAIDAILADATPSKLEAGQRVNARHRGGTRTAKVGDEEWVSADNDPRYVEYTARHRGG
jgi:hypothetical protein